MTKNPLLVFDFDGVIIDGIAEYWSSSRKACLKLLGESADSSSLPYKVPEIFKLLRPWVHYGWEMVIIAAELIHPNNQLTSANCKKFTDNYTYNCNKVLSERDWQVKQVQEALDSIRRNEINNDLNKWISLHKGFPGIQSRINELKKEGNEVAILTTKSKDFTLELLNSLAINVDFLFGHESGTKIEVLIKLSAIRTIKGFIEDRRSTLEKVLNTPKLNSIPCFLASWGYLKPNDCKNLPKGIHLLETKTFAEPLANWH